MCAVLCLLVLSILAPSRAPRRATPLAELLAEADRQNPEIQAALETWKAEKDAIAEASTLPDPHLSMQQMAVGSPVPFSSFTKSGFAYLGIGVSQEFPWPGTLKMRGDAAASASDAARAQLDAVRRRVRAQLRTAYAELGAIQATLGLLDRDADALRQMEQIAEARYRVGQGSEPDVLRAQLEQTKLQREVARRQEDRDVREATLKKLLGRAQDSPDLVAQPPAPTPLPADLPQLLARAASSNPAVHGQSEVVQEQQSRVALARKAFRPDFSAQFMWQHTAASFPDYYMFTVDARVPLHWRHRQVPLLAEAADRLSAARAAYTAEIQADQANLREAFARAQETGRELTIDTQGLMPQAQSAFQGSLLAYQSGRLDFESLLNTFRDLLSLEMDYWQTVADHESAIASLEQQTGTNLP